MILERVLRRATPPALSEIIGEHDFNDLAVGLAQNILLSKLPLSLGRLLGQNVALVGFTVNDLLLCRHFEPFAGSLVRF